MKISKKTTNHIAVNKFTIRYFIQKTISKQYHICNKCQYLQYNDLVCIDGSDYTLPPIPYDK